MIVSPNSMKFMLLLLLYLQLMGCYAMGPNNFTLYSEGRFSELAQYEEMEITKPNKSGADKISDIYYLCEAYFNLKKYDKVFSCIDNLEVNLKRINMWLLGVPTRPSMIRAAANLELGNYSQALKDAQVIYSEHTISDVNIEMWRTVVNIRRLSLLTIAYALNNDRANAEKTLGTLENTKIPVYGWGRILTEKRVCLARAYMTLGKYDKALSELTEGVALSMFSAVFRPLGNLLLSGTNPFAEQTYDSYVQVPRYFMMSKALLETGNIEKAKQGYDSLLERQLISSNGEIYWLILYDRGRIAEKEGSLDQAIDFYKRAIEVIEQQRSTINTEVNKIGFVGDKQDVYHHLIRVLYSRKEYDKAFEYVERAKSRALVDLLAAKKDFAVKVGDAQEIRSMMAKNDAIEVEAINQDTAIDKSNTRGVSIKVKDEIINKAPELASLVTVTSKPVTELQNILPQDEILLEYYYRDKDLYAFILSSKTLTAIKLNGDNLAEDVIAFRKSIEMLNSAHFLDISLKLYQRLFQPIEHAIDKRRLTIVPHSVLHYLPINALHDGGNYLIDRYSIRMMPSADALRYLTGKKSTNKAGILAFGNPDLGDPKYDLAYAQKEAIEVIKTSPNSKVFLRKEASEEALRKYGSSYNYIHFATHGQFYAETPLKSALRLSPDSQYDGVISADKLYSMQLDADLVTLSACDTGLSKIANGDDLVGLTRGFLYAGSSSIVASLWKVDDLATSQLMMRFYKEMQGTDKREALRTAALETKEKYPHPYYWASFQLTGMSE